MNRLELFNILRPIVTLVTGLDNVILTQQTSDDGAGIPSPSGEYITIEPKQSVTQRGQANIIKTNSTSGEAVDYDVRAQVTVEASINVFRGVDAISRIETLLQCNKRPDVRAMLQSGNVGWQRTSAPNNLTGLQSGNPEQRAQLYIYLYYETSSLAAVDAIESASVEVQNSEAEVLGGVTISVQ